MRRSQKILNPKRETRNMMIYYWILLQTLYDFIGILGRDFRPFLEIFASLRKKAHRGKQAGII